MHAFFIPHEGVTVLQHSIVTDGYCSVYAIILYKEIESQFYLFSDDRFRWLLPEIL